ncbi:MAG TPA: permease prefix domain 1-containing protein [Streptosporangiaceae bacterium]
MAESGLITGYLSALSAQLPAPVVAELADGLDQTRQHYLDQGLSPDAAAEAAVAEFGPPRLIVAAFTGLNPARHAARRLLATGPAVGACWAAALVTTRAWTWPVPAAARIAFGLTLVTVVGLLATAALGSGYRFVRRAGTAGWAGIAALDVTMVVTVLLIIPAPAWPVILAMAASMIRIAWSAQAAARAGARART